MYRIIDVNKPPKQGGLYFVLFATFKTTAIFNGYNFFSEKDIIFPTHWLEPVTGHFFTDAELKKRDKEVDGLA